jgi:hypothetical protein
MQKLSKYVCGFFFCTGATFPTIKIATATDNRSQPVTVAPVVDGTLDREIIPIGFNSERYARLWERNPFTLVTPRAPPVQTSVFDKLILTSWLRDGRTDVVFIQNTETNQVEKITGEPNLSNLRLIALHLNPNAQFVEAVLSDGKEQGAVKFRFDAQSSSGQVVASPVTQTKIVSVGTQPSNPDQVVPTKQSSPQLSPPNLQTSSAPLDQSLSARAGSGSARNQIQKNRQGRSTRGQGSEGLHLASPASGP